MRLGANSVLKIVTLRDEGVALSVVEGTASVRLAKFDRDHEYFEIDAPKTTLAAEKKGLYRIDVSREGRVRLSARDGGRARIYSETSGFALRDGRTAELSLRRRRMPVIGNSSPPTLPIHGTTGLTNASAIWPSVFVMTFSITTATFGAPKISTLMATGPTRTTTAGSGGRIRP